MNSSSIIGLVNNAALLLALGLIYDMLGARPRGGKPTSKQFLTGVILGAAGIAIMLNPWEFGYGVVFDTRSVLLSMSGLFFGTIPMLLAVLMTGTFRLCMGGAGAWTGVAVIVTSGGIGLAWRHLRRNRKEDLSTGELYLLGIVVHVAMLLWMFSLPWPVAMDVLSKISLPVMLIYPVITVLLGWLMVNRGARKRMEKALKESEERYRSLVETITDLIFIVDPNGSLTYLNPEFENLTAYPVQDFIGQSFAEVLAPEYIESTADRFKRDLSGETIPIYEVELKHKDGNKVPVELKMTSLLDDDGKAIARIGLARDIRDRKQAEQALRESGERLKNILDTIQTGVVIIDVETREIVDANPAAVRLIGAPTEEIIGQVCHKYICPAEKGACPIIDLGQKMDNSERILLKPNGEEIPILKTVTPIRLGGRDCLLDSFVDLTDRKKTEEEKEKLQAQLQQAQKMESIGTLAGGIAHDFNNVLYSIIGYSELTMNDVPEDSLAQKNLKEVLKGALRAKDMVKQILAFSRKAPAEKKPIKVQSVVEEALKLLRTSIPSTIEIRQNIDTDCGPVLADSTQIHQVIMNLGTNAYQAMREKGGVLELTFIEEEIGSDDSDLDLRTGTHLKLIVSDTGHGMGSAIIEKIYEPYFTTRGPGEGTGMGLAVIHGIVKSHSGDITVSSKLGEGTTFSVYLPLIKTRPVEPKAVPAGPSQIGTERILFVDDEEYIVLMTQQILERLGYYVTSYTSSVEALETFRAKPNDYDLIITDMTMPNMTGIELASKLLEIRHDIPVILCTGFSEMIDEDKAKNMGISAYIMKPILIDEIAGTIRKVLDEGEREIAMHLL